MAHRPGQLAAAAAPTGQPDAGTDSGSSSANPSAPCCCCCCCSISSCCWQARRCCKRASWRAQHCPAWHSSPAAPAALPATSVACLLLPAAARSPGRSLAAARRAAPCRQAGRAAASCRRWVARWRTALVQARQAACHTAARLAALSREACRAGLGGRSSSGDGGVSSAGALALLCCWHADRGLLAAGVPGVRAGTGASGRRRSRPPLALGAQVVMGVGSAAWRGHPAPHDACLMLQIVSSILLAGSCACAGRGAHLARVLGLAGASYTRMAL